MNERVLVIAPHPDDETLGAGGYLSRLQEEGKELHWLIVTDASEEYGWDAEFVSRRQREIESVANFYPFSEVHNLELRPAGLDTYPRRELIQLFSELFARIEPETILLPWIGDPHSDHQIAFECALSASKSFRMRGLHQLLAMEILSETNFGYEPVFEPNLWVDISSHLQRKLEAMAIYQGELGTHPFPRSLESISSQATLRGAQAGVEAAEAFRIIRQFV